MVQIVRVKAFSRVPLPSDKRFPTADCGRLLHIHCTAFFTCNRGYFSAGAESANRNGPWCKLINKKNGLIIKQLGGENLQNREVNLVLISGTSRVKSPILNSFGKQDVLLCLFSWFGGERQVQIMERILKFDREKARGACLQNNS